MTSHHTRKVDVAHLTSEQVGREVINGKIIAKDKLHPDVKCELSIVVNLLLKTGILHVLVLKIAVNILLLEDMKRVGGDIHLPEG
jgi:hypothetical protein